ncbi:MAG: O-methyltransferase [Bacteroidota bacterium]
MKPNLRKLFAYCEAHTTPHSELLHQLDRETHLKTLAPQMLSGHLQGRLLSWLSRMQQPEYILEIGTFTGYAALCLAEGLQAQGQLHTIEANEELEYLIRKYFQQSAYNDRLHLHIGDAKTIIPQLQLPFDMVFVDAGKMDYAQYYDMVIEQVRPGGLILADNVLWDGKVIQPVNDPDTEVIRAFNTKVQNDERVENILLPIRDGLIIARKL